MSLSHCVAGLGLGVGALDSCLQSLARIHLSCLKTVHERLEKWNTCYQNAQALNNLYNYSWYPHVKYGVAKFCSPAQVVDVRDDDWSNPACN